MFRVARDGARAVRGAGSVRRTAGLALLMAFAKGAGTAHAAEAELTADTTLQMYELRSENGAIVLPRRRILSTLGVALYDLEGRAPRPGERRLSFVARLRIDGDAGVTAAETDPAQLTRFVPGLQAMPVDLMFAYVEGRHYLGGALGFRLGRQYTYDALGYWSFDGAHLRLDGPLQLAAEAYAGLEVRGGLPLSSPRFEREGIWRGSRSGLETNTWSAYTQSTLGPAAGANLEWAPRAKIAGHALQLRLRTGFRRVHSTGTVSADAFGFAETQNRVQGTRLSQERFASTADVLLGERVSARAGWVYDNVLRATSGLYGTLDWHLHRKWSTSLDYDFFRPSFDADSIFAYFATLPSQDLAARLHFRPTDRWDLGLSGHARTLQAESADGQDLSRWNAGGQLSVRYRYDTGRYGMRAQHTQGVDGRLSGLDLFAERTLDARYLLTARLSLSDVDYRHRAQRSLTSFGVVMGMGYQLSRTARTLLEVEQNVSDRFGQRFRVLATLSLAVF